MNLYRIITDFFIKAMLPITKRTAIHTQWLVSLFKPFDWTNQNLSEYSKGSTYSNYSSTFTYSVGNRVSGTPLLQNFVYESLTASNYGVPLTNTASWQYVNNNSIGATERIQYTSNTLTFEYALNKFFKTTFRAPNGVTSSTRSDIYINNNIITVPAFFVGVPGPIIYDRHYVYDRRSDAFVGVGTTFVDEYQYSIYVPTASLAIYGSASVKNIADRYNAAPLKYNIIGY
jgi:hypothetical protein